MLRFSRIFALVLAIVLLADQSLSFAIEQLPGTLSQTETLIADEREAPMRDHGKSGESALQCSHGSHFHNHLLGQITQAPSSLMLALGAETLGLAPATPIPTGTLEAPYRPPRFTPQT